MKLPALVALFSILIPFSALGDNHHSRARAGIVIVQRPGVRQGDPENKERASAGNVWFLDKAGRKRILTSKGLAFSAQVAADGETVGWIDGEIDDLPDKSQPVIPNVGWPEVKTILPAAVVIWREGKLRRFLPEIPFYVTWKFVHNGEQVAICSQGGHGVEHYQLFDTKTGKTLYSKANYLGTALPAWTRGLLFQKRP